MARRETLNEAYLDERVTATGGETRKVTFVGRKGAPDRLCGWITGRSAWVEVKEEDQPWGLQAHQEREHTRLRAWGQRVYVLYNKVQIDGFIEEMTRSPIPMKTIYYCECGKDHDLSHPHTREYVRQNPKAIV